MAQLLRFHFRFSRKTISIFLFLAVLIFIIYSNAKFTQTIDVGLYTFSSLLTIYVPILSIAHMLSAQFSVLIRILPISPRLFVKSSYLYTLMLFSIVFIPLISMTSYQYFKGNISAIPLCYMLGIFAFTLLATGGALKAHFKQPTKTESFSNSDLFFYILLIFISHVLLCLFFFLIHLTYIGAIITPIACFYLFYRQYLDAIKLYEQAEFL
ncbi:MAG: hypothetical protein ABS942_01585 [Solibacillus sp.]|uniref:hypothetical protein n=1 Tax=Solibacillus sp. FSL H8-0523 TaxID=2954511 RepID=UPI003101B03B